MKRLSKVVIGLVVLGTASGCGMMIGTPDYWQKYNETIIRSAELRTRPAPRERITESDRGELDSLVNKKIAQR